MYLFLAIWHQFIRELILEAQSVQSAGFISSRPNWVGPPPQLQVSVAPPPPLGPKAERLTRWWGRGSGDPIPKKGQTLWYSVYTIILLRE